MNDPNLTNNPFAALFSNVALAEQFSTSIKSETPIGANQGGIDGDDDDDDLKAVITEDENIEILAKRKADVDVVLQQVFLITLDSESGGHPDRPSRCVFLEEVYSMLHEQTWLDTECLEQAVFERLMVVSPGPLVVKTKLTTSELSAASQAGEYELLRYLSQCYSRLQMVKKTEVGADVEELCLRVILQNGRTSLQQPEVFCSQQLAKQLLALLHETQDADLEDGFLRRLVLDINEHREDGKLTEIFQPIFEDMKISLQNEASMFHPNLQKVLHVVTFCTCSKSPCLAQAFLDYNRIDDIKNSKAYENSLLGTLLSLSCIARKDIGPFEFFEKPSSRPSQEHSALETRLWERINLLNSNLYRIFHGLLSTKGESRHQTLEWIGDCLHANAGRAKIWSSHMPQIFNQMYCSDGFFMNLCGVLLRLCVPFCKSEAESRLLSFRADYHSLTQTDTAVLRSMNVHMRGMKDETCLLPAETNAAVPSDDVRFSFITECLFMTHCCLGLGVHVVNEKFVRLSSELHRMQQLHHELQQQGASDLEAGQRVQQRMDRGMSVYLSLKASLLEPSLLELMGMFHVATAKIMCQLAVGSHKLTSFGAVRFPLPLTPASTAALTCIPEAFVNNILDYMIFLRRFKDEAFEMMAQDMEHFFTLILIYMGSPDRVKNPHLRARMAEGLETLTPHKDDAKSNVMGGYCRERLFTEHPSAQELARTLLNVFVSIEMTGQSVEFEQKFNYRHPMYKVLEYMWKFDKHKTALKSLAQEAESNIEAVDPPIFLRFINLLINDAIFLLDEALDYLSQIKEKQEEKEQGQWRELSSEQQQEAVSNYRHLEMLCRYHNSMGNNTVQTIEMLTTRIKFIFNHNIMVDRVAAMLNYFLLHLVGPKRKNFRVKDFDGLEFKPHELVSNICRIYINLATDDNFCRAVSRDGRSYSPELFLQAENVLLRIHSPSDLVENIKTVAKNVQACTAEQAEEDEAMLDAPEEYLDPIMGTLMKDPVLLPSSKQIVDRTTIARHLLSDQNDPFNRSPLDMSMIETDTDLKDRIHTWLREEKQKKKAFHC